MNYLLFSVALFSFLGLALSLFFLRSMTLELTEMTKLYVQTSDKYMDLLIKISVEKGKFNV